jgi:predicted amidohydrolase YtcJ
MTPAIVCVLSLTALISCSQSPATLILSNCRVYTMDPSQPWAAGVVITGDRITAVLDDAADAEASKGPETRVIDLGGKFVVPGFIDGHVHFNRAGELINDANLMAVADDEGLRAELQRVVEILDKEEWITGGLWGAYEQWQLGAAAASETTRARWQPSRWTIDELTADNPCLLSSFDSALYLANTPALIAAGLTDEALDGMEVDDQGRLTGLVHQGSPALERLRAAVKPKSHARLLEENRAALRRLAESGIVEVHDIAKPEQTTRFVELQKNGELTCRVWLRPDLSRAAELGDKGLTMGQHPESGSPDPILRYGALKGYIDGIMGNHSALFFEAYDDQPDNYGHYRRHTSDDPELRTPNMEKMYGLLKTAHETGFVANVHAIGTKGVSLMLDTYERLMEDLGHDLQGYRVIHAQVIREQDLPRFRKLNVIAEVNPYHISDDMRWMEQRIGSERCRGAYAFKSLLDNGATLSFGSDWPGTSAAEYLVHPRYLIHAAVNRTTIKGTPEGGWYPEQKISVHEALAAYTINNAYAAFEDDNRGSISVGKLADLTVCDRNLLEIDPEEILDMNVDMTIVDGRVVFKRGSP